MTPQKIQPEFGRRFAEARQKIGMTQREAASKAGITPVYLCQLEHGDGIPSMELAAKLADVVGITLSRLLQNK